MTYIIYRLLIQLTTLQWLHIIYNLYIRYIEILSYNLHKLVHLIDEQTISLRRHFLLCSSVYPDSKFYKIECSYGMPYIGETGCSFITRICEHSADIKYDRLKFFALAEHSSSTKHHIYLENAKNLSKEDYFKRKLKEAIVIKLVTTIPFTSTKMIGGP